MVGLLQDVVGDQAELTLSLIDGTHLNSSVSIVPAPFVALEYRNFVMALQLSFVVDKICNEFDATPIALLPGLKNLEVSPVMGFQG